MSGIPKPPGVGNKAPAPVEQQDYEKSGLLESAEVAFILDSKLNPKKRRDPVVIGFIEAFVRCHNIAQASSEVGIHTAIGYKIRHSSDVAGAIAAIVEKSVVKYGFDATEIMERTKEIVDFDPIVLQNPDGSFKDNINEIPAEARRNLKKMKVKNIYNQVKDLNGIESKIVIGKVIEYEFYDKLKAIDMVGSEKNLFTKKTQVEHTVSKDMASILLASAKRGEQAAVGFNKVVETTGEVIEDAEVVDDE